MTYLKTCFLILVLSVISINSNAQDEKMMAWANQGTVTNDDYNSEIPFRYVDGYIFIDIVHNDKTYNFLFDTGAEATVIHKSIIDEFEYKPFSVSTVSGPIIKNQDVSTIILSSVYISDVEFVNIGAVSFDMEFDDVKFCDQVDGIIGSTLMKKSKWQIDYDKQIIRLSDDVSNLLSEGPKYSLKLNLPSWGWGTETIELNLDGYVSQFNFDTGNGREAIVLKPTELKNFMVKDKNSIIEYGFNKSDVVFKLVAQNVTIGDLKLKNQSISFQRDVGNFQLIGNRFFEDYLVTVDWEKHQIFLEPTKNIGSDALVGFELNFRPNFENNKIEVETGLISFTNKHKIRKGAILSKVNDTDISNFSNQEFCDFWHQEWPKLKNAERLNIVITQKGKTKEIVLTKKTLT